MIPETEHIPESIQCPDCGSAVRPGASFCFKCGKHFEIIGPPGMVISESAAAATGPVSAGPAENDGENEAETEQEFHDTIRDSAEAASTEDGETPPAAEDKAEPEVSSVAASVAGPLGVRAKPQLTSAAAMRRKPKPQREKIEMVWEQPEGTSNPVFVIGTIVIFVLVLLIVLLVYLMK